MPSDFSPTPTNATSSGSMIEETPLHEDVARDRVAGIQASVKAAVRHTLSLLQDRPCVGFSIETLDILQIPMSRTHHELSQYMERMCDMVNAARWSSDRFYIGIAVDPYERMTNSFYGHFSVYGWNRMHLLAAGDSDDVALIEKQLIDLFIDFPDCTNRRRGGGGRCPHGTAEFCYVVVNLQSEGVA